MPSSVPGNIPFRYPVQLPSKNIGGIPTEDLVRDSGEFTRIIPDRNLTK